MVGQRPALPRRPPEVLLLVGSLLAVAGNVILLADPGFREPYAIGASLGIALAGILVVAVVRMARHPRTFVLLGVIASAIAFATPHGLPGGIVALAGAIAGLLATYDPS